MTVEKIFIATPMFSEGELDFARKVVDLLEKMGFEVFWCYRDEQEVINNLKANEKWTDVVFKLIIDSINKCDTIVANLDGIDIDSGTSWEVGYAFAKGKRIIGIRTDSRLYEKDQIVNLMIQQSSVKIVKSLDELEKELTLFK